MSPFRLLPASGAALTLTLALALALNAAAAPGPGSPAPGFSLSGLLRPEPAVSLKSLEGKVVLVDFWASWCPPCRKTLPHLSGLRARHPSLVVLAISIDEDRAKALDFLKPRDTSMVFLHDADRATASAYDLGGMPSLYLIDGKGVLRYRHDGYTEGDMRKIEAEAERLVRER